MCADLLHLGDDLRLLELGGADLFHLDIMDGHFVPNLSLGLEHVRQIKAVTSVPLDVHLMVSDPEPYLARLADLRVEMVSFHLEATPYPLRVIRQARRLGMAPGLALNPSTPPDRLAGLLGELDFVLVMAVEPGFAGQPFIPATLGKIEAVRAAGDGCRASLSIEVDGGISVVTGRQCVERGAGVLVAGSSSIFKGDGDLRASLVRFERAVQT
jgi:ribulose-phosphate 3-epimerase